MSYSDEIGFVEKSPKNPFQWLPKHLISTVRCPQKKWSKTRRTKKIVKNSQSWRPKAAGNDQKRLKAARNARGWPKATRNTRGRPEKQQVWSTNRCVLLNYFFKFEDRWTDQQTCPPVEMQIYISVMFLGLPDDIHEEKPSFLDLKKMHYRPTD